MRRVKVSEMTSHQPLPYQLTTDEREISFRDLNSEERKLMRTISTEKIRTSCKLRLISSQDDLYKMLALGSFEKYSPAPLLPRQLRLAGRYFLGLRPGRRRFSL